MIAINLRDELAKALGCNPDGTVTIDQDYCTDTETFHSYPKQYKHIHMTMPSDELDKVLAAFKTYLIAKQAHMASKDWGLNCALVFNELLEDLC
ncbi:MAG: hypothetical protein WC046_07920 [Candidatus Bathyarchaeia archaeon]